MISHIRVLKFCVFCLWFPLVHSAYDTVLLFWQAGVYIYEWGCSSVR